MEELQLFNFENQDVRTVLINEEPYFVGKEIADILGYQNGSRDINRHVSKEDMLKYQIGTSGQRREQTLINESGLYSLIFNSKLETAKKFKHWVTNEVLPTIRKHGAYMTSEMLEQALLNPDTLIKLATDLKNEREMRLIAQQQVHELKPKADYCDKILSSKSLVPITYIAKDYGLSGRALNEMLHELGIQYKQGGTWLLYSKYQAKGWTQSETKEIPKNDGTTKTVMHTKWTQKGRLGLYEILKKNDVLPMIERDAVAG